MRKASFLLTSMEINRSLHFSRFFYQYWTRMVRFPLIASALRSENMLRSRSYLNLLLGDFLKRLTGAAFFRNKVNI
jgi:hypothetical protein